MVTNNRIIFDKLEAFINRYYTNELIRGTLFFLGLGLLYFLFTLSIEYFLWLQPAARTFLFWSFILVETFLLLRFILFPLFKLFHIQKGISYVEASKIIGNHFPEVKDKLLNLLQLSQSNLNNSDLLLASIDQKSQSLALVPFGNAINFKANVKFLPIALIPLFFFFLFFVSGNSSVISQSFNRVLHYNTTFLKPAPFQLQLINPTLSVLENEKYTLKVKVVGKVLPQNIQLYIAEESYFMEQVSPGIFHYTFAPLTESINFHLEANTVVSPDYTLDVVKVPSISQLEMKLVFPSYLKRKNESIIGTGNAVLPEGTRVVWNISGSSLESVQLLASNVNQFFTFSNNVFFLSKNIFQDTQYQLITSNSSLKNYQKLPFELSIVKDQFPTIDVTQVPDSIGQEQAYFIGKISDDYGFSKLQIVYYEKGKPQLAKRGTINLHAGLYDQFVFGFPSTLAVQPGVTYEFYFEVFDNDPLHHFKSVRSSLFTNKISTQEEIVTDRIQEQQQSLSGLSKTLDKQSKQIAALEKLNAVSKQKKDFDFKTQQQVNDFIQRQEQQDKLMQSFSEKIKSNLTKEKSEVSDKKLENLQSRIEKASEDLERNKKLLEELKALSQKLDDEQLQEKLQQFKQLSKNQVKTLEQLVELTKRYYVDKKTAQLAAQLQKLSQAQKQLSEQQNNSVQKQEELQQQFNSLQNDLSNLKKDNQSLKAPFDLPKTDNLEKSIEEEMKEAQKDLSRNNGSSAQKSQKKAAQDLKKLSETLQESMNESEQEQLQEDVSMLRQILDNLLSFSFSQESLMKQIRNTKVGSSSYNASLKTQQSLKTQFKHIDDSLFTLSLRNEKITEMVTKELGTITYNLDNAIDKLGNGLQPRGVSYQQFVVAAANKLADFLSELLQNMQMNLSGQSGGKPKPGQGQGLQLPDIISKQKGLSDKMQQQLNSKEGKPNDSTSPEGKEKYSNGTSQEGEGEARRLLEIYKEQQALREALQNQLQQQGSKGAGQNVVDQMKQVEKQLLNKGFKNEVVQRMKQLNQELLKLESAQREQGQDNQRQSETNLKPFSNQAKPLPPAVIQYMNSIEILNRQSLPLRTDFNQKVQRYFKQHD